MLLNQKVIFTSICPSYQIKGSPDSITADYTDCQSHPICPLSHDPQPRNGPCVHESAEHRGNFLMVWASARMTFQRNVYSVSSHTKEYNADQPTDVFLQSFPTQESQDVEIRE